MSTNKFTRGEWQPTYASGVCIGVEAIISKDKNGTYSQIVVNTVLPDTDLAYEAEREEIEANANLIAASKDLLEALIGVLRVADRKTIEFDAARAAIEKATALKDHTQPNEISK